MITLASEGISLSILPERGGKITSLLDLGSGREWLHTPEHELVGPVDPSVDFDHGDVCGWDEMVPTIEACLYPGTAIELPDHGELWRKSWDVVGTADNSATTRVRGDLLDYELKRSVTLDAHRLSVDYELVTHSEDDIAVLWAGHPLFALQAGTRLYLSGASDIVEVREGGERSRVEWPHDGFVLTDLLERGSAKKLFARTRAGATVSLVDPDGGSLSMQWPSTIPWLGLWLDNCLLSNTPIVGIEPTNANGDSLEGAVDDDECWILRPGSHKCWNVEVSLGNVDGESHAEWKGTQ